MVNIVKQSGLKMYKILCTGNPDHPTIASGVKKVFPNAHFASRSTGYDLRMWDPKDEEFFCNNIVNYNVLINSAFISGGAQQKILELTHKSWKAGHIFNIGSTAEYEGRNSFFPLYSVQKRALRDLSLSMNSKYLKTTHITVGGLNDGKTENQHNLDPMEVANAIKWILESRVSIPIIGIEKL
jgi:NAD(P)-dependent dehydrogenase (short-subunit alcohol dehydrogenase family)